VTEKPSEMLRLEGTFVVAEGPERQILLGFYNCQSGPRDITGTPVAAYLFANRDNLDMLIAALTSARLHAYGTPTPEEIAKSTWKVGTFRGESELQ
jgi:hypothetical protein